jgi:type IV pilus assembly protein PilP
MRTALIMTAVAVLLAGCGGEQSELRAELKHLTKDLRGRVEPLPQVKPYEPVPYTAENLVDPFRPERIVVAQAGGARAAGGLRPDLDRPKEALEAFPLESIKMVGTLLRGKQHYALVTAGNNLYRVKRGNYMGQNFGVITSIDDSQVTLKELIQDSGGDWTERTSSLQLQEVRK